MNNFICQSFASAITEEDKKDPNIKFYTENNPGWVTVSERERVEEGRSERGFFLLGQLHDSGL